MLSERHVIDLHCDTLSQCLKEGLELVNESAHLSLDRLPEGYRLCQCMAVYIPDDVRGAEAGRCFDRAWALYRAQLDRYANRITGVEDVREIGSALEKTPFAAILTVEGGAVLEGELHNLDRIYRMGVRMMTLTWNGANEICGGAAVGTGFTSFGKEVVGRMEELGMVVDVSHLSDTGFWELCDFARRPFVASHSNSRRVCDHRRNLTDGMFQEICDRGGLVGLNYYENFITDTPPSGSVDDLLRHVHHFLELGGEDTLALGSDFDGADMPRWLSGVERIGWLRDRFVCSGIPEAVVEKIFYENARSFFAGMAREERLENRAATGGPKEEKSR